MPGTRSSKTDRAPRRSRRRARRAELAAQERRVPDDELGLRPVGLLRLRRVGQVEQGVAVLDVVERLEDRVASVAEAVADHPLDVADPDGHPGQLGGVGVELDAEDGLGADLRELHRRLADERAPLDGLPLEVLERPQRRRSGSCPSRTPGRARARGGVDRGRPRKTACGFSSRGVAFVTFLPDSSELRDARPACPRTRAGAGAGSPARRGPRCRRGRCSARRAARACPGRGRARTGCRRSPARRAPSRACRPRAASSISAPVSGSTSPASNRPPLNQSIVLGAEQAAVVAILANSSPRAFAKTSEWPLRARREALRMPWAAGRRPRRTGRTADSIRKWATSSGSWPRSRRLVGQLGEVLGRLLGDLRRRSMRGRSSSGAAKTRAEDASASTGRRPRGRRA